MNEKPEALRWDVGDESSPGMYTHPDGDWVRYVDYKSLHAENEALRRDAERWKDLATDAVSGLSYIRQYYGQLAGVGWDRVFAKKAAIDAAMENKR